MYLVIYLLVILIFSPFIYEAVRNFIFVMRVKKDSLKFQPNIITCGRLVKGFTIEKVQMLMSHSSFENGLAGVFVYKILKCFGLHEAYSRGHLECLRKLIIADLYNRCGEADYLVNYTEHSCIDNDGGVFLFASCNSVKMYPETIPLYTFPEKNPTYQPINALAALFKIGIPTLVMVVSIITSTIMLNLYSNTLVDSFSQKKEELLWSYVEKKVLGVEQGSAELSRIKGVLDQHLNHIKSKLINPKYDYKLYVLDVDIDDLDLYPAGHIVLTKGMAKDLERKDQLDFFLLHIIAHFEAKDHIKLIKNQLLTYNLLTDVFSSGSYLASWFINTSDMEHDFQYKHEIVADRWALEEQNRIFGGVGGFEVFAQDFYDVSKKYNAIFNSHPFSAERTDQLRKYVEERKFADLADVPLDYGIAKTVQQQEATSFVFETDVNTDYFSIFNDYKKEQGMLYNEYQGILNKFSSILQFKTIPSVKEIELRKERIHEGWHEIDDFSVKFEKHLQNWDEKMQSFFHNKKFDKLKVKINEQIRLWQSEQEEMSSISEFYFSRDKKILEEQYLMLNFIGLRHETVRVGAYGVTFSSPKEQSDYNIMQKRLEKLIKTPPPSRQKKT